MYTSNSMKSRCVCNSIISFTKTFSVAFYIGSCVNIKSLLHYLEHEDWLGRQILLKSTFYLL